jgi:hypothetical protein
VTTTTTEGRLAEIGRRIDEVHARAQTRAATKAGRARTEAEDAIRELRSRRNGLARRVDEVRSASGAAAWHELKRGVAAARAELELMSDGASAKFD